MLLSYPISLCQSSPLPSSPPRSTVRPGQPSPQEEEEDSPGGEGEDAGGPPFSASAAAAAGSGVKGGKGGADKGGKEALLLGARQPSVQKTSERAVLWGVSGVEGRLPLGSGAM